MTGRDTHPNGLTATTPKSAEASRKFRHQAVDLLRSLRHEGKTRERPGPFIARSSP